MRRRVFYAWESSLPEETHRRLIERCLRAACEKPSELYPDVDDLAVDQDTQGMPGSPDMAAAILEKIRGCDVFVADVSMTKVETVGGPRNFPNPNVMLELGYAVASRTWERILMVLDTSTGMPETLPFDLRHHRVIPYELGTDPAKEEAAGEKLVADLKEKLGAILKGNLALLALELGRLLKEINPILMDRFRRGARKDSIDVPTSFSQRLEGLMKDKEFTKLATFEEQTKVIMKPDVGPVKEYRVTVTDKFVELAG
jgi:hypothetical protein